MCLHFADFFVAFAGDSTLDISRQSITMKRHRSRRQKKQQLDVISFLQSWKNPQDSSDDDDFDLGAGDNLQAPEPSFSVGVSMSSADDFDSRLDKMSSELDGLVRFVRRGVESLAGGTSDAAPAFGVLAFALEDWDI
jgi:gamma-tubulin complex component 5